MLSGHGHCPIQTKHRPATYRFMDNRRYRLVGPLKPWVQQERDGKLLGIVQRAAVQEALNERAERSLIQFGGIVAQFHRFRRHHGAVGVEPTVLTEHVGHEPGLCPALSTLPILTNCPGQIVRKVTMYLPGLTI